MPNEWGIFDMHGNVYEWCWGTAWKYPGGVLTDPIGAPRALSIVRGGAWNFADHRCRSAARFSCSSKTKKDFIGFRFVIGDPIAKESMKQARWVGGEPEKLSRF
jgi:formylglycine-generating enzyme required for sulfatase activity